MARITKAVSAKTTASKITVPKTAKKVPTKPTTKFYERLVLARFLLDEFGLSNWDRVREQMREVEGETDANGCPNFLPIVRAYERERLGAGTLESYDLQIRAAWKSITDNRREAGRRPRLLYFQYLALLGSHRYLERLFHDRAALLAGLNTAVTEWNEAHKEGDHLALYSDGDLNKLAFWSATGSGKTLLMHAQVLQYLQLAASARAQGWKDAPAPLDHVFLVTPSEALSRQHQGEAVLSGLTARPFVAGRTLFDPQSNLTIETIEITRLGETSGEKVVALSALEGHNLVLVDEGHRGASGEVWKRNRDALSKGGLALEYSATFGQAVGGDNGSLSQEYARCIAFDYSYRRFYNDGYGKEFQIYNLAETSDESQRDRYLTACALSFWKQRMAFKKWGAQTARFGFENPLWVFVGGSVSASSKDDVADVVGIALFFQKFAAQRAVFEAHLAALLHRRGGLLAGGRDPFAHAFDGLGTDASAIYSAMMEEICGASGGGVLTLDNLKGADGEVALRIGDNPPFGLINVGDTAKFLAAARDAGLPIEDKAVSLGLFQTLSKSDSSISVLIGAKKFSEGWNSFRVSTLGLMKVGQGEGAQIIQLFGRGVRLRGFDNTLRRSTSLDGVELPAGAKLKDILPLETLGVFGLKSTYMAAFQDALRREDAPTGDNISLSVVTRPMNGLDALPPLHTLRAVVQSTFATCHVALTLGDWNFNGQVLKTPTIKNDLYARLESLLSAELTGGDGGDASSAQDVKFGPEHLRWIDWNVVIAELRAAKDAGGWHLLRLDRAQIQGLFTPSKQDWYELKAPAHLMQLSPTRPMASIALWQSTIVSLLVRLSKKVYDKARADYERQSLRLESLNVLSEASYEREWLFTLSSEDTDMTHKIENLWDELEKSGRLEFGDLLAFDPKHHFFRPLISLKDKGKIKVTPVSLDAAERAFVEKLESFLASGDEWLSHRKVFLLRNKASKGIGFYDDGGGFYPDFALWIWEELPEVSPREYLTFIDPKGLVHFEPDDAKVTLYTRIKDDQKRLGDSVTLNSFLISTTPFEKIKWKGVSSEDDLKQLGVFLPETPVKEILDAALR